MTKAEILLFNILRSSLGNGKVNDPVFLSKKDWRKFGDLAVNQGVGSLVLNELSGCGNNLPEELRRRWEEYSLFSSRRFDAQLMALSHLTAVLEEEGIRAMVLKGVGLALCYPTPQLRECTDIDIFCFDDFDKVNGIVVSSGLCPEAHETEEKHFGFEVDGIEVENHSKFTSEYTHASILTGKVLQDMSREEQMYDSRLPGILLPKPQMGALHLLVHTIFHLGWSGISARQLCDITAYFSKYRQEIDLDRLRSIMDEARISDVSAALLGICHEMLGLEIDLSQWPTPQDDIREIILHSIFNPIKSSAEVSDPLRKILIKLFAFRRRRVLHKIIYKEEFPDSFLKSFSIFRQSE